MINRSNRSFPVALLLYLLPISQLGLSTTKLLNVRTFNGYDKVGKRVASIEAAAGDKFGTHTRPPRRTDPTTVNSKSRENHIPLQRVHLPRGEHRTQFGRIAVYSFNEFFINVKCAS